MYIYERNKVGHRYFQRPLSSQSGSVFRQVRRGDAVQTAFTSGRAGRRRQALPPGSAPACRSGDSVALWVRRSRRSAQRDAQPCSSHEAGSIPPRVPCSPALGWGRVFPKREIGDGKWVLEHMDLHRVLRCLCISSAVCMFEVISRVVKRDTQISLQHWKYKAWHGGKASLLSRQQSCEFCGTD